MKILSAIFTMPFTPIADNAMLWRVHNLKKLMDSESHETDLTCYIQKNLYNKVDLTLTDKYGVEFKPSNVPLLDFKRDIQKNKYDLIFANAAWAGFNVVLSGIHNPSFIVDMHGLPFEEFIMNQRIKNFYDMASLIALRLAEKASLKYPKKIICVSEKMREYFHSKKGINEDKLYYLPNGVDLDFFRCLDRARIYELRQRWGLEDKLILGYIGGFQKWQGVDRLIETIQLVNSDRIFFLIVGSNSISRTNNALFLQSVPREEVINYYSICDVLVLPRPSHVVTEVASPTKFAEYASMGKPILASNVGDPGSLVKEYNCGVVIENNNVEILKDSIKYISSLSQSELVRMGNNSRKLAENEYNWNKLRYRLKDII